MVKPIHESEINEESTEEERGGVIANLNALEHKLQGLGISIYATVCEIGKPAERIVEIGRDFELITVSDSRKSRLKRVLVGSVAFDVMKESTR